MSTIDTKQLLSQVSQIHSAVERAYLEHPAIKTQEGWLEKRKLLLADISLHMVQATLKEPLDIALIQRYLYSILIISHEFLPQAGLSEAAERLISGAEVK